MDKDFPVSLKECRKMRGLSQQELGEMLGVSKSAVALWEKGYRLPRAKQLKELEVILGLNLDSPVNSTTFTNPQMEDRRAAMQKEEAKLTTFSSKYVRLSPWARKAVEGLLISLEEECKVRGELLPDNYFHCDIKFTVEGQNEVFPNDESEK